MNKLFLPESKDHNEQLVSSYADTNSHSSHVSLSPYRKLENRNMVLEYKRVTRHKKCPVDYKSIDVKREYIKIDQDIRSELLDMVLRRKWKISDVKVQSKLKLECQIAQS